MPVGYQAEIVHALSIFADTLLTCSAVLVSLTTLLLPRAITETKSNIKCQWCKLLLLNLLIWTQQFYLKIFLPAELESVKACSLVACVAMPPSSQANARRICFFKNALVIFIPMYVCTFKLYMLLQAKRSDKSVMQEVLTYLPCILATVPRCHVGALVGIVKYVCVWIK